MRLISIIIILEYFLTRRHLLKILLAGLIAFGIFIFRPLIHLFKTFVSDRNIKNKTKPIKSLYINDASKLNETSIKELWQISPKKNEAEEQIKLLLKRASEENLKVSIAGAKHSMGDVIYPGGVVIDILPLNQMRLNLEENLLYVQAGAQWNKIVPYLDSFGYSVMVMQSNNNFSVGGSLGANCHGWQTGLPPIASTVDSFRICLANGEIKNCNRNENKELFSLVLGGYGLFGVLLEITLKVVKNENYVLKRFRQPTSSYAKNFKKYVEETSQAKMAYGRLSVDTRGYLQDSILNVFYINQSTPLSLQQHPKTERLEKLARIVFRGSVGSEYGKRLRWDAEVGKYINLFPKEPISRNRLFNEPVSIFSENSIERTDILHEYFVPKAKLEEFLKEIRKIIPKYKADLLNITIRDVKQDLDCFLSYARQDVFGLVMLFNYPTDPKIDKKMEEMTQEMIDSVLDVQGTYYLPYRLHASPAQFRKAYPQANSFFELKRKYDPMLIFQNKFYQKYST